MCMNTILIRGNQQLSFCCVAGRSSSRQSVDGTTGAGGSDETPLHIPRASAERHHRQAGREEL